MPFTARDKFITTKSYAAENNMLCTTRVRTQLGIEYNAWLVDWTY